MDALQYIRTQLRGRTISDIWMDSEESIFALDNGTVVTIHGLVLIESLPASGADAAA